MFEELVFVLVVIFVVLIIVAYASLRNRAFESGLNLRVLAAKEKLLIAERKFMQGKIKKGVFEALIDQMEEEMLSSELALLRLHKAPQISTAPKAEKILAVLEKPTSYRRAKINSILKETELLRNEMGLLEIKLLKREITQRVFEKLIAQKEAKLISKEQELTDVVAKGTEPKNN